MAGKGGRRGLEIGPEEGRGEDAWALVMLCMRLYRENCRPECRVYWYIFHRGHALLRAVLMLHLDGIWLSHKHLLGRLFPPISLVEVKSCQYAFSSKTTSIDDDADPDQITQT